MGNCFIYYVINIMVFYIFLNITRMPDIFASLNFLKRMKIRSLLILAEKLNERDCWIELQTKKKFRGFSLTCSNKGLRGAQSDRGLLFDLDT